MTENDFDSRDDFKKSRVSLRLPDYDYSQSGAYYVTVCANKQQSLFGDIIEESVQLNTAGAMIRRYWVELKKRFETLTNDEFVVMPNHVHGIVILQKTVAHSGEKNDDLQPTLGRIIQWFKTMTTNAYIRAVRSENLPEFDRRLWQKGYYKHIIRNDVDLQRIREYIVNNPMKWAMDKYNPTRSKGR